MPENIPPEETPAPEDSRNRFRRLLSEGEAWEEQVRWETGEIPVPPPQGDPTDAPDTGDRPAETQIAPPAESDSASPIPNAGDDSTIPLSQAYRASATPPPPLGTTPQKHLPALDERGMPLPRRVDEIDVGATRVSPSAYVSRSASQPPAQALQAPLAPPSMPVVPPAPPQARAGRGRRTAGCLLRLAIAALFLAALVILAGGSFVLYQYYQIAATLPSVDDLRNRASQFETTRILDRNGNLLYEIIDPTAGRRTYVSLKRMSPFLIAATLATEDKNYYSHPGFDPWAILRAFWQNYQSEGETVSGASTITQQLARILLFDPDERYQRTYMRKVREALLAEEITRRYTKEEILELYLNEIYYSNLAYGVEAAAQTYFNTSSEKLTLGQSAFLAGLPQAPYVYDIYTNPEATMSRMQDIIRLMYEASQEQNCIYVSTNQQPVCIELGDMGRALNEIENYDFKSSGFQIRYPHWVNFVRFQLEQQFDAQTIYRSGFTVYTTLDPAWQDRAQQIVAEQIAALTDKNASNGALVAINPKTGEILALIGSADYYDEEIDGQVNMALAPRQPGSSIKPITYVAALEKGWTPSTLIWDVPSEFPPSGNPDDPRPPYKPVNYDGRFHGPVTLRSALANSYNIPAVKALEFTGIYDNPETPEADGLIAMAQRLGITTLTRGDYGMSLTLGGGEVPLLEMAGAFSVFANNGRLIPPVAITRIVDRTGATVFEYRSPAGEQVIRPEHAFLISHILSDNNARTPAFGPNSVLNLPFQAAAKTGTTNDFRDNWTVGYTPGVVVGVWVGNADNTPMVNTSGLTGAAPIWAGFMQYAVQEMTRSTSVGQTGGAASFFNPPAGITEKIICAISGAEPSRFCPRETTEFFAADQLPLPPDEDLWTEVLFDTWTGLRASASCNEYTEEELAINATDPWAVKWIRKTDQGKSWAESVGFEKPFIFVPKRACKEGDPRPLIDIKEPPNGSTVVTTTLKIVAVVDATKGFDKFRVEYGNGDNSTPARSRCASFWRGKTTPMPKSASC
ncbi:MAG: transglycosylase domain-containing protein, partial [Anaerolineales bacterium]